jgi:hypothetical protein
VEDLGMDAPGTKWSYQLFTKALEMGLGDDGNQGLYKVWGDWVVARWRRSFERTL